MKNEIRGVLYVETETPDGVKFSATKPSANWRITTMDESTGKPSAGKMLQELAGVVSCFGHTLREAGRLIVAGESDSEARHADGREIMELRRERDKALDERDQARLENHKLTLEANALVVERERLRAKLDALETAKKKRRKG